MSEAEREMWEAIAEQRSELMVGRRYDVETTDGTVYKYAALLEVEADGTVVISYGPAVVYVATHELARMTEVVNP